MKKTELTILSCVLFSLFSFAQTTKQIKEMNSVVNEEFSIEFSKLLENNHQERENRVSAYLTRMGGDRTTILQNGTSKYIFDISLEGKPLYYAVDNNSAVAIATLTNTMYGAIGLATEGQNMRIGVWDENRALGTHQEFTTSSTDATSRMSYGDNAITGASTNHATHVAGTMVARGVQASARGMAFRANIVSYNWAEDVSEVRDEFINNGTLVTNHSYGIPMYNENNQFQVESWRPGCYTSESIEWDQLAYERPYVLSVVSAGNEGNTVPPQPLASGLDQLVGNKVSKNNLVVANATGIQRSSDGTLISLQRNSSSSKGPSDDLRIKPDISGIGTNVYSPIGTSTTDYTTLSGTSMAAPNISGSILLLQQYYGNLYGNFMRAATLKGIVCLTADDAGNEGPDPEFGWGLLNMKNASDLIRFKGQNKAVIEENVLVTGQVYTKTITLNESGTLLAGISWTDPAGTSKAGLTNSLLKALVNDLNIRITKDGETYYPWMLDTFDPKVAVKGNNITDNVEIIRIDNAESGVYTITVNANGSIYTPSGQPAGQAYSLIVYAKELTASASINDFEELSDVRVYPNPVIGNVLFIENSSNSLIEQVEIYDVVGKKILSSKINNNSVDVSQLTSGVYFVKIYSGQNQVTKKIIKK